MKKTKNGAIVAVSLLASFVLWTIAVCIVDVQPVGPQDSSVGFAAFNLFVHDLTGTNFDLYTITDILGLVPIGVCVCFGVLGFIQLIKRKSIRLIDRDILFLGGFYIVTIAMFALFETVEINYRPVLINGVLEASYPSSTTMLVMCVMPTTIHQIKRRIKKKLLKNVCCFVVAVFTLFMVIGRILSGVHWITDIIGGILFSSGLVALYCFMCNTKN